MTDPPLPPVNQPPTARAVASPTEPRTGQFVTFDASSSSDAEGPIARYQLGLDLNGTYELGTGLTPTMTMAFYTPGLNGVRVLVTDALGATDDEYVQVYAHAPPPPAPARPPDRLAPSLDFVAFDQELGPVLRRGFRVRIGCSEACLIGAQVDLDRARSRRLRIGRNATVLGKAVASIGRPGSRRLTLPFSRPIRQRLARVRRLPVTLRVWTTDSAGNLGHTKLRILLAR